ncbi:MAG: hypothetical protein ACMG6E_00145 [Candidatus Roizmanbacteria bacterium]
MDDLTDVLNIFNGFLTKGDDYTVAGVEAAFQAFCDSLTIHEHKPPPKAANDAIFMHTTLQDAIARYNKPVHITYKINKYGNKETTIIPGAIVDTVDGVVMIVGLQDGAKIAPLGINEIRCCQANGFAFDSKNTVGSAKTMTSTYANAPTPQ